MSASYLVYTQAAWSAESGLQQLPQNSLQDPTVAVVIELNWRVDPHGRGKFFAAALWIVCYDLELLAGAEIVAQVGEVEDFLAELSTPPRR